jgi:hypothetical protein
MGFTVAQAGPNMKRRRRQKKALLLKDMGCSFFPPSKWRINYFKIYHKDSRLSNLSSEISLLSCHPPVFYRAANFFLFLIWARPQGSFANHHQAVFFPSDRAGLSLAMLGNSTNIF